MLLSYRTEVRNICLEDSFETFMGGSVMNDRNREKTKQVEKKLMILLAIFSAVFITGILFAGRFRMAKAEESTPDYKYYTSIEIESGDSLWSIAGRYMDDHYRDRDEYIHEVRTLNHLTGDEIHAGGYLLVPYYSN